MRTTDENADLKRAVLEYHELPRPGKMSVTPTEQLVSAPAIRRIVNMTARAMLGAHSQR